MLDDLVVDVGDPLDAASNVGLLVMHHDSDCVIVGIIHKNLFFVRAHVLFDKVVHQIPSQEHRKGKKLITHIGKDDHVRGIPVKSDNGGVLHNVMGNINLEGHFQEREGRVRANIVAPSHHVLVYGANITRLVAARRLENDGVKVRAPGFNKALFGGLRSVCRGALPESVQKLDHNVPVRKEVKLTGVQFHQ